MRRIATLAALVLALVPVPSAHAGTAWITTEKRIESDRGGSWEVFDDTLNYAAGLGELNDATIRIADGVATVTDSAGVEPGDGCARTEPADPRVAVCPVRPPSRAYYCCITQEDARVALYDGPDRVRMSTPQRGLTKVDGGTGDDRLLGSAADDFLIGGEGRDWLEGAGGFGDRLRGGPGSDELHGDQGAEVDYGERTAGVSVDLDGVADDGEPGENDLIGAFVTSIRGGAGDDILTGNDRGNGIYGGPGADVIALQGGPDVGYGDGGADRISGGTGDDSLGGYGAGAVLAGDDGDDDLGGSGGVEMLGGAGDDDLEGTTAAETLDGGPGTDKLWGRGGADTIRARDGTAEIITCDRWPRAPAGHAVLDARDISFGCASVDRDGPAAPVIHHRRVPVFNSRPRRSHVDIGCPDDFGRRCVGTARFLYGGSELGRGRWRALPGRGTAAAVTLNSRLTRLLARRRQVLVRVRVVTRDSAGRRRVLRSQMEYRG